MENENIGSLVVFIPDGSVGKVVEEIEKIVEKCKCIKEIDNQPVSSITQLNIEGSRFVRRIGITYLVDGKEHHADYTKEEFYDLVNQ